MRKKVAVLIVLSIVLAAWTIGCKAKSDYETYMKAQERTEAAARGKSEMKMDMRITFNKEGLDKDVSDALDIFEDMAFELRREYDNDKTESLNKIFMKVKDTGIDVKVYVKDETAYIITPLIPKIVVLKGEGLIPGDFAETDFENPPQLSKDSIDAILKVWKSLYDNENVAALEKIVLDTPEGSVKATKYMLSLTDSDLKPAIRKTIEIILNDSVFIKDLEDMMQSAMSQQKDILSEEGIWQEGFSFREILKSNMDAMEDSTIKTFNQVAYIDRDNYIIEERLKMDMLYHFTQKGAPRAFGMEMTIKNWDINKGQDIYFPDVTPDNSITLEELKEQYSDGFSLFGGDSE